MPEFRATVKRPKGSISARVIKADGTIVEIGTIAGEGRDAPENLEKGRKARERLNAMLKKELKEERHG